MLAIEYEPNIQENINQMGGDLLIDPPVFGAEPLFLISEQDNTASNTDGQNQKYFKSVIININPENTEFKSDDSLYGFMILINLTQQNFVYFDWRNTPSPLTHILLKVVAISDTNSLITIQILKNKSDKNMVTDALLTMQSIITGRLPYKTVNKKYQKLGDVLNEVNIQQKLFKATVIANETPTSNVNIPVCPSILGFFYVTESDAKTKLLEQLNISNTTDTEIYNYLNNASSIGCIAMEYAGQSGDQFITLNKLNKFLDNTPLTDAEKAIVKEFYYISIYTNILRMLNSNVVHTDLHGGNCFVNVNRDLINEIKKNTYTHTIEGIDDKSGSNTATNLIIPMYSYILDFGRVKPVTSLYTTPIADENIEANLALFLNQPPCKLLKEYWDSIKTKPNIIGKTTTYYNLFISDISEIPISQVEKINSLFETNNLTTDKSKYEAKIGGKVEVEKKEGKVEEVEVEEKEKEVTTQDTGPKKKECAK